MACKAAVQGGVVGQARQQALQHSRLHDQYTGQDHGRRSGPGDQGEDEMMTAARARPVPAEPRLIQDS
jgi:hypothetical protein